MNRHTAGSSMDPDDIEERMYGDGSCSHRQQSSPTSDLGRSLSTSNLEKDAVPCTPDSLGPDILLGLPFNQGEPQGPLSPQLPPSQGHHGVPRVSPSQGSASAQGLNSAHSSASEQRLPSAIGQQGNQDQNVVPGSQSHQGQAESAPAQAGSSPAQARSSQGQANKQLNSTCTVGPQSDGSNNLQRDSHPLCPSNSLVGTTTESIAKPRPDGFEVGDIPNQGLIGVVSPGRQFTTRPPRSSDTPPPPGVVDYAQPCQVDSYRKEPSIERDTSLESISAPKDETYDAVLICHEYDRKMVDDVKERLNKLILYDGTPAKVATENDIASSGRGEIDSFDDWLRRAEYVFLWITENFCRDCKFQTNTAIVDSLMYPFHKKEYVIPIFLENKYKARYIRPSLRAIKGINNYNTSWEKIEPHFEENLNKARRKRIEEIEKKLEDLDIQV